MVSPPDPSGAAPADKKTSAPGYDHQGGSGGVHILCTPRAQNCARACANLQISQIWGEGGVPPPLDPPRGGGGYPKNPLFGGVGFPLKAVLRAKARNAPDAKSVNSLQC